jgi:hypothetical protein
MVILIVDHGDKLGNHQTFHPRSGSVLNDERISSAGNNSYNAGCEIKDDHSEKMFVETCRSHQIPWSSVPPELGKPFP